MSRSFDLNYSKLRHYGKPTVKV